MSSDSSSSSPRPIFPPSLLTLHHTAPGLPGASLPSASTSYQPTPPQAPIIRQPVGFSFNAPTIQGMNTYPATTSNSQPSQFLPGQEIGQSSHGSRRKRSSKDKDKDRDGSRSKSSRRDKGKSQAPQNTYPSHPVSHGDRLTPMSHGSPIDRPSPSFQAQSYVNQPTNNAHSSPRGVPPPSSITYHPDYSPEDPSHRSSSSKKSRRHHHTEGYPPPETHQQLAQMYPPQNAPPAQYPTPGSHGGGYDSAASPGSYAFGDGHSQSSRSRSSRKHGSQSHAHSPAPSHSQYSSNHSHAPSPSASQYSSMPAPTPPRPKPRPGPILRMLSILIEDKRLEDPEGQMQFAEVKVPLRPADNPEDGFWTDAKDVCDALQATPARIDGPAKVYTMRGRYRQYFLRVSAGNDDECTPANLSVSKQRTLDVFVENYPTPGMFQVPLPTYETPRGIVSPQPRAPIPVDRFSPSRHSYGSHGPSTIPSKRPRSAVSRRSVSNSDSFASHNDQQFIIGGENPASPLQPTPPSHDPFPPVDSDMHTRSTEERHSPALRSSPTSQTSPTSQESPCQRSYGSQRTSTSQDAGTSQNMSSISTGSQRSSFSQTSPLSQTSPMPQTPSESQPPPPPPPLQAAAQSSRSGDIHHAFSPNDNGPSSDLGLDLGPDMSELPSPSSPKKARLAGHTNDQHATPVGALKGSGFASWNNTNASSSSPFATPRATPFAASSSKSAPFGFSQPQSNPASAFGASSMQSGFGRFAAPASQPQTASSSSLSVSSVVSPQGATSLVTPSAQPDAVDNRVGSHLRSIFSKQPGWEEFVKSRSSLLPVTKVLQVQYGYIQKKIDDYVRTPTPVDLEGASNVSITKTQVLKAFSLTPSWGDDCTEALELTALYGPGGERYEDPRVVRMLDEPPPISTTMQVKRYLALLREIHNQWTTDHPDY